jgi:hypothetical protein
MMQVRRRRLFTRQVTTDSSKISASHRHLGVEKSLGAIHRQFCVCEGAVVDTLTISAVAELPPGVAEGGETEQLAAAGAPLQVNDTDWLNPPTAAMLSEYCAVCPGVTVAEPDPPETTPKVKSCAAAKSPNAPTPLVVPTYTFPLAIVGVMNLLPVPNWSRAPAWLLL